MSKSIAVATTIGCFAALPLLGLGPEHVGRAAGVQRPTKGAASPATYSTLPSLGGNAEANGINDAGTVIVGRSFDRQGLLYAVKWTMHNGAWVISALPAPVPYPGSAAARGIDNFGNVAGFAASSPRRPVYWPAAGGSTLLGCDGDLGETQALSANGQIIVGHVGNRAAAWYPPGSGSCTEFLPPLEEGGSAGALAVTGDGSIIGGRAARVSQQTHVPVRWVGSEGQRQLQQLDARPGSVRGANESGDLAGTVTVACPAVDGCERAVIWSASGAVTQLGTLGGQHSWAYDINAEGEVVGLSAPSRGDLSPYFWSASTGMVQLPANRGGYAFALSDVRLDGTRLVVGTTQGSARVWIVRNR